MNLYIVRHGKARKGGKDRLRPLMERGIRETRAVALLLRKHRLRPSVMWHSDRVRAVETAKILAAVLRPKKMIEQAGMGPDDSIGAILGRISRAGGDLMIVGHLPFLDKLVSKLVSGKKSQEIVRIPPSTVVALSNEERKWQVVWVLPPLLALR